MYITTQVLYFLLTSFPGDENMSTAIDPPEYAPHKRNEKVTEGKDIDASDEIGLEHGHMQELEVDLHKILKEEEVSDIDGDESPYAEGTRTSPNVYSVC